MHPISTGKSTFAMRRAGAGHRQRLVEDADEHDLYGVALS
jgi:hypothetical protein